MSIRVVSALVLTLYVPFMMLCMIVAQSISTKIGTVMLTTSVMVLYFLLVIHDERKFRQ